ncbi:unnamed protein product, partial [Phaeothamnion confervicola]
ASQLHYNTLKRNEEEQTDSPIYHLRRFNNWVKSVVHSARKVSGGPALRVLDLACGKGGDVGKWGKHPAFQRGGKYVGIDYARKSLDDAVLRLQSELRKSVFPPRCAAHSILPPFPGGGNKQQPKRPQPTNKSPPQVWEPRAGWGRGDALLADDVFDVASMQFALHYMAQSEARIRQLLDTVSR